MDIGITVTATKPQDLGRIVTNSERSAAACPQRWLLQYGLGLRPTRRTRVLDLGSLVHAGLEAYFGPVNPDPQQTIRSPLMDALNAVAEAYDVEVEKVRAAGHSADGIIDPDTYIDPVALYGLLEDKDNALRLIGAYHQTWTNAPFRLVHNEQTLTAAVKTPSGRGSPWTRFGGKIDKVVEYNGNLFIVEHKTTSLPLGEWVEKHRRSPQTRSYAWLLAQHGIHVAGCIFDLIQSKPPRAWDALPVLKDGKRLAKVAGIPWTTATEFWLAVQQVGQASLGRPGTLDDADWYRETHNALESRDRDGFWLRREVELFSPEEMRRTEAELYRACTDIRRWGDDISMDRVTLFSRRETDAANIPARIEDILHRVGSRFPRESGLCWQYNRLCQYASLCASWSAADCHGFAVTAAPGGHAELTDAPATTTD